MHSGEVSSRGRYWRKESEKEFLYIYCVRIKLHFVLFIYQRGKIQKQSTTSVL